MIAITGAGGYIGQAVLRRLALRGEPAVAISRGKAPAHAGPGLRWVQQAEGAPLEASFKGCDTVIHLAGRAHAGPLEDPRENEALFDEVNNVLALRTAQAAARAGVRRFVFVSTLGVHGNWSAEVLTAQSAVRPDSPYARAKLAAEEGLRSLASSSGLSLSVVRPPMVYGPRCPGNFARLAALVRTGLPLPFGSATAVRSFVAVENIADFLVAASAPSAPAGTFALADGSDWSLSQLTRHMAGAMARPTRLLPCPPSLLRRVAAWAGRSREMDSLTRPMQVDGRAAWEAHGWQPIRQPLDALREAAASFAS